MQSRFMTKKAVRNYTHQDKPITIYYYGDGKGKTTAALGLVLRAVGYDMKVLILQAIKGSWPSGEQASIARYLAKNVKIKTLGRGFIGIAHDKLPLYAHRKAACNAMKTARREIESGKWDIIVLDEFADLPTHKLVTIRNLVSLVTGARRKTDIIITGHRPIKLLISRAQLVSEIKKVKHPFDKGIIARRGLDF
mgnify:CR=1 FL=1